MCGRSACTVRRGGGRVPNRPFLPLSMAVAEFGRPHFRLRPPNAPRCRVDPGGYPPGSTRHPSRLISAKIDAKPVSYLIASHLYGTFT